MCVHLGVVYIGMHVCMNANEGQRLRFDVFLSHSPCCFLEQGLSLNLGLADLGRLSVQ